jgi:hypothetical protein
MSSTTIFDTPEHAKHPSNNTHTTPALLADTNVDYSYTRNSDYVTGAALPTGLH